MANIIREMRNDIPVKCEKNTATAVKRSDLLTGIISFVFTIIYVLGVYYYTVTPDYTRVMESIQDTSKLSADLTKGLIIRFITSLAVAIICDIIITFIVNRTIGNSFRRYKIWWKENHAKQENNEPYEDTFDLNRN